MADQPKRTILRSAPVAEMYGVDVKTVRRWADEERIPHFKTRGGHLRFYQDEIEALVKESHRG